MEAFLRPCQAAGASLRPGKPSLHRAHGSTHPTSARLLPLLCPRVRERLLAIETTQRRGFKQAAAAGGTGT